MVSDLLVTQCHNSVLVRRMQREQLELVAQTLDCLVEVLQGPCVGNQDFIANHPAMGIVKNILMETEFPNVHDDERVVVSQVGTSQGSFVVRILYDPRATAALALKSSHPRPGLALS